MVARRARTVRRCLVSSRIVWQQVEHDETVQVALDASQTQFWELRSRAIRELSLKPFDYNQVAYVQ
jgi:hypothetical protein